MSFSTAIKLQTTEHVSFQGVDGLGACGLLYSRLSLAQMCLLAGDGAGGAAAT